MKILRPREGDPGLSQGPQKFLGDRIAERISPVGGCVRGQGHWLWGHTHLVLISAQPLMSSAAPKNKDKAHKGLGPGAKLPDGETLLLVLMLLT